MNMYALTILGDIISKKNKYRIRSDGKGLFKPKVTTDFSKMFAQEVMAHGVGQVLGPCKIHVELYHTKKREPDLDGAVTTIMDCLQESGVVENDRNIVEIRASKVVVPGQPRAVILIGSVDAPTVSQRK